MRPEVRDVAGDVDLSDPFLYERGDPHETWRALRERAPVAWQSRAGRPGFWNVTRYDDVVRVSGDPETFCSGRGVSLGSDRQLDEDAPLPPDSPGRMLLLADPPDHAKLRTLVSRWFTPRAARRLEPHIREVATAIIDEVAPRGECELVADVAAKLPLAVICELMGIPREDWDLIIELGNRSLGADDPDYQTGTSAETSRQAAAQSYAYFVQLVAERRRRGGDDLVSELVGVEVDGERLSEADLVNFCVLLSVAGNETTRNTLSGGVLALAEHPAERTRLRRDPSLVHSAVEEILRWVSPIRHFYRVATRDTELGGQVIREGERVVMWYPSANRDEAVFGKPDHLDVGRDPNRHVAFGVGPHFCLGAQLARLELQVMLAELLRRLGDIEPAGEVRRLRSCFMGGIKELPVRFTPG